jgi:hypothetical protein
MFLLKITDKNDQNQFIHEKPKLKVTVHIPALQTNPSSQNNLSSFDPAPV